MSVLKSRRTESKTQYINEAINLELSVIEMIARLSVRYQRIFSDRISQLAIDIVSNCEMANAHYPKSEADIFKRKELLVEAKDKIRALDVQLALIYDVLRLNPQGAFNESDNKKTISAEEALAKLEALSLKAGELIDLVTNLINKVIESDKKRVINVQEDKV